MKLLIFFTIFACFFGAFYAQFDHTFRSGATINLATSGTVVNSISTFSGTVQDQVVGANCRCNIHNVNNVRTNNGPFNSGSYFEVRLLNTANATLNYYFGEITSSENNPFEILDVFSNGAGASAIGAVGICTPSATECVWDYYCDFYPNESVFQVVVCSDASDNTLNDAINFYTLTVIQHAAAIQTIGTSRSLAQTTGVIDNYDVTNPGPSNFAHYYHALTPTAEEDGRNSRLFIEAVNWGGATGTAYICVSFSTMVANTNSLSGVVFPGGDINGPNIIPNSVFTNSPDGCQTFCQSGSVSGTNSVVVASFAGCSDSFGCGFPTDIWIGVRTPSSTSTSTYTVRLRFRDFSIPDVLQITSFTTLVDSEVAGDNCDGNVGDYSCENYYHVTTRPSVGQGQPGPYLAINVFAVHDTSVTADLTNGYLGGSSLCPGCPVFDSCTTSARGCWLVAQPCQWPTTADWYLAVQGNGGSPNEPIEFGLEFDAGTWPVTNVEVDEWQTGKPFFGSVKPFHYQHYQVTFSDSDLFDDSYFYTELYTYHEKDEVGFYWNYEKFADDGTCYGYQGACNTASSCANGDFDTGFCRFLFLPCPYQVDYNEYSSLDDGLKVSQLFSGTYYFSVQGLSQSDFYVRTVEYTVLFNIKRTTPIFDRVPISGLVYYLDYSSHYHVALPVANPTLLGATIRLHEVTNGRLTLYARCDALAGDCPCWTADESCSAGDIDGYGSYFCSVDISKCDCPSGNIYISVQNTFNSENYDPFGVTRFKSASFGITVVYNFEEIQAEIANLEVSRAVEYANQFINSDFAIYKIDTTNIVAKPNDILVLGLTTSSDFASGGLVSVSISPNSIPGTGCAPVVSCTASSDSFAYDSQLGYCDIVLYPCYPQSDCGNGDCTITNSGQFTWNYDDVFYVVVEGGHPEFQWALSTQVIDQSPLTLSEGVTVYGYVAMHQYVHYAFDLPSNRGIDETLVFELYSVFDKMEYVTLYIHYAASGVELAGRSSHCYQHDLCFTCSTETNSRCIYEIHPCDLQGLQGTYYVSVWGNDPGFQYPGQEKAEYTLTASLFDTTPLLSSNLVGIPISETIYERQYYYYSVTVPTLVSGDIVGRILTIEIGSADLGTVDFTIDQIVPHEDCGCAPGATIGSEMNEWRRYSCELISGEVYYIGVQVSQDVDCAAVSYIIHARIYDIIQESITLTSVDSTIVGSFDTTTYSISHNEWRAIRFTTNAIPGTSLNVEVTQPDALTGITKVIEARLSIGSVATRTGYNSDGAVDDNDVGPLPGGACVANRVCTGELRTRCSIYVPPCAVPEGSTTWFLTFTGEDLPVATTSDPISISIRVVAPTAVITFPTINDYTTTSTTTGIGTNVNINRSYGRSHYLTTGSNTGISPGDSLVISYSGSASVNFFVRYQGETGSSPCLFDCSVIGSSTPSCTFDACSTIGTGTWYVSMASLTVDQSGTISVRRFQSPSNSLTVTPITTFNTPVNFDALTAGQWRYHSINVPASTTSYYEVLITGGASFNDVVYVGTTANSAIYLPGHTLEPNNGVNELTVPGNNVDCGGIPISGISNVCCYDQDTSVFAVVGSVGAYTIEIDFIEFSDNEQSINVPSVVSRTTIDGEVAWFSFTFPSGNHLWFDLTVDSGSARLYLNKGARAGSDAVSFLDDFGACWYNVGIIQQICPSLVNAGQFCDGFIASDCYDCIGDNNGSTYYFAVIPDIDATYSLTVISQTRAQTLQTSTNNNLLFPSTGSQTLRIIDDTVASTDFAVYSHFVWTWTKDSITVPSFLPVTDDPDVLDEFTYPYVEFFISNVNEIGTSASADDIVNFYINVGSLAGDSDCYGGRDITLGGSLLPCLENPNGAASIDPATGDITCSVLVCDLNCVEDVYFSVGRAVQDITAVSFSVTITELFSVSLEVDIVNINLSSSGFTSTYSNVNSGNEVVYFRMTGASIASYLDSSTQFLDLEFNNYVGTDSLDIRFYVGSTCSSFNDATPLCAGNTGDCFVVFDPCFFTQAFIDESATYYFRVSRNNVLTPTWGFVLDGDILTANPIDASETRVSAGGSADFQYSAVKEIFGFEWHFYEFVLVNNGYGVFEAVFEDFACSDLNFDYSVYASFEEFSGSITNVARPNRWPTNRCAVDEADIPAIFGISNFCNYWGGIIRFAVFADFALPIYDDPILGVQYPAVYSISVTAEADSAVEWPLNCLKTGTAGKYYIVRPDSTNRGTHLSFSVSGSLLDTLFVSKNANPFEFTSNCAWGAPTTTTPFTDIRGDYFCDASGGSCTIDIPNCEYVDDTWFIYVVGSGTFTFIAQENRVYTPVVVSSLSGYSSSGVVTSRDYQYYNFLTDTSADAFFQVHLSEYGCTDNCDLRLWLFEGSTGFAGGRGANGDASLVCSGCDYGDCSCSDITCSTGDDGDCVLTQIGCGVTAGQLYVGVGGSSSVNCPYIIEATFYLDVVPIVEEVEICVALTCNDYYQLVSSTVGGATDFSESVVFGTIVNYDDTRDITVYVQYNQVATDECNFDSFVCGAGDSCDFSYSCNLENIYLSVYPDQCTASCLTNYALSYDFTPQQISTVNVGNTVSTSIARVTSSASFYTSASVDFSSGVVGSCGSSCGISFPAGTYYFYDAQGVSLLSFNPISLSSSFTAANLQEGTNFFTFSVNVPNGVDSFVIELEDFAYPVDAVSYGYTISYGSPSIECSVCSLSTDFLTSTGCNSASVSVDCAEPGTYFFTLIACESTQCDKSFRIRALLAPTRTQLSGSHTSQYTTVILGTEACASGASYGFYTIADGPLSVHVKEVGDASSSASVSLYNCAESNSCSAQATDIGNTAHCRTQSGCDTFSCASGLYYIDVTLLSGNGAYLLQVVNQWVDLQSSVSSTIQGSHKHFYRTSNNRNSLTFALTVTSGPALRFVVFDGCDKGSAVFSETQVCAFGTCYINVPTLAKYSGSDNYYIELESYFSGEAEWDRNFNTDSDTLTTYTLSYFTGSQNCEAPPSTGFCADPTFAGVNVWSDISNSQVYSFVNPTLKDQEAQCLYNTLSDRCPYPTDECRYWLKVFSCLEAFPQCDGSGFQLAPCVDVCNKVVEVCGNFWADYPFECCRDRYTTDSDSTCFNIPPPPPPPPTFDDPHVSYESSFPPPIDVPVFPTIYATLPPASEFFTFSVFKDAEVERELLVNSVNSSNSIQVLVLLLVALVAALL